MVQACRERFLADTVCILLDGVDVDAPPSGVNDRRQFPGFAQVVHRVLAAVEHFARALVADGFLDKTAFHGIHLAFGFAPCPLLCYTGNGKEGILMKEIDFEAIRKTAFEKATKQFDDDQLSKAIVLQAELSSIVAKEMLIEYHRQLSASE